MVLYFYYLLFTDGEDFSMVSVVLPRAFEVLKNFDERSVSQRLHRQVDKQLLMRNLSLDLRGRASAFLNHGQSSPQLHTGRVQRRESVISNATERLNK